MRILHTSDWHLGVSTGPVSRVEEQELFLEWLIEALRVREVDVLIVAGDVFDSVNPSTEALSLYFRFLARVAGTGVRSVVVVGGNHDSPSRLDAPQALLEELDVHVVGGVPVAVDDRLDRLDRMIVPLRVRGSDEVAGVCLAVPYVHEYRLGVRTTDLDVDETRAAFKAAFSKLYADLADRALERFGDVPLVATGHLTMGTGATREDYPQEIHQVGTLEGLPAEILDPRVQYTALGHIHRCYAIKGSSAWYCGSPIPYGLPEMAVPRHVLVVEVGVGGAPKPTVERVEVPLSRDLVGLVGTPDEVVALLTKLTWTARLPPLVHVRAETKMAEPGLDRRLLEAVATHDEARRPILVELRQRPPEAGHEDATSAEAMVSLDELTPKEVFGLLCNARHLEGDDRARLEAAFGEVEAAAGEVFEEMLAGVDPASSADKTDKTDKTDQTERLEERAP